MSLTVTTAQLAAGTPFVITQPQPGQYLMRWDPEQTVPLTPEQRAANYETLTRLEAQAGIGVAR